MQNNASVLQNYEDVPLMETSVGCWQHFGEAPSSGQTLDLWLWWVTNDSREENLNSVERQGLTQTICWSIHSRNSSLTQHLAGRINGITYLNKAGAFTLTKLYRFSIGTGHSSCTRIGQDSYACSWMTQLGDNSWLEEVTSSETPCLYPLCRHQRLCK